MLGLDDHPAGTIPGPRRVGQRAEDPLRLPGLPELTLGPLDPIPGPAQQHGVLSQPQDVADAVGVTPPHQSPAAEAAVGPDRDLDLRPGGAEAAHQEFQDGAGVLTGVDLAGAEVSHQQFVTAGDVQRQEAVLIIVAVEEAALLLAMDRVVGGIEVEDQGLGGHRVGGHELIDQDRGESDQGLAIDAVLQAAERRRGGQRRLGPGIASGSQLQHGVMAQGQVIVEVLVAQRDGDDPLGQQALLIVPDHLRRAWIGECGVEGVEEPGVSFDLAEQQGAGVGGEPSALEVGDDVLGSEAGKGEGRGGTVCHGDGLARGGGGESATSNPTRSKAIAQLSVREY